MKRVRQHIIEEESRKEFANILPSGWVANDFHKDYGKDIHVEIFKNNNATGKSFIVQLKATDSENLHSDISIPIKVDILEYYETILTPVLLVFYSTKTKLFRGIWANFLLHTLDTKPTQKQVTIKLTHQHYMDTSFFISLESKFENTISLKTNLTIENNSSLGQHFRNRILKWMEKYYSKHYSLQDERHPFKTKIVLDNRAGKLHITVSTNGGSFELDSIEEMNVQRFVLNPYVNNDSIEAEEAELLFILSSCFSRYSPTNSLQLLKGVLTLYKGKYKTQENLQQIGLFAIENGCAFQLQELIDTAIENELISDFQHLNNVFLTTEYHLDSYSKNLLKAIHRFSDKSTKGIFSYNIANFYRNTGLTHLSFKFYNQARKLNEEYLMKEYWWQELAGVAFVCKHYKISEKLYKKAISLKHQKGSHEITYALLGDSLLWQGKFLEANDFYLEYLQTPSPKSPSNFYVFSQSMCEQFISHGYHNYALNEDLSYKILLSIKEDNEENEILTAIEAYPLNSWAWFKLSSLYINKGDFTSAYAAIRNSALLKEDINLWLLSSITAHLANLLSTAENIFSIAIQFHGLNSLNEINKLLSTHFNLPFEQTQELLCYYEALAYKIKCEIDEGRFNLPPRLIVRNYNGVITPPQNADYK